MESMLLSDSTLPPPPPLPPPDDDEGEDEEEEEDDEEDDAAWEEAPSANEVADDANLPAANAFVSRKNSGKREGKGSHTRQPKK
jgi:hypothetical protein